MRTDTVEQLFVRRRAGRISLLMVLESPAGERERETLMAPTASPEEAVCFAARHLGRRGIRPAARVRVRVERGGSLVDDAPLRDTFVRALKREGEERWD
ncbi:MAG: hypothetical protein P8Y05_15415 [Deinococcales bacterium]